MRDIPTETREKQRLAVWANTKFGLEGSQFRNVLDARFKAFSGQVKAGSGNLSDFPVLELECLWGAF